MKVGETMLYLILSMFNLGKLSLPQGSESNMGTNSTETSGTFICPLILGYLLFLWKGYFPSWGKETGVLPPSENSAAAQAGKAWMDLHDGPTIPGIKQRARRGCERSPHRPGKALLRTRPPASASPWKGISASGLRIHSVHFMQPLHFLTIFQKSKVETKILCTSLWACGALWH